MRLQHWKFTMMDTGFFRDGQPFHAREGGHDEVGGSFPPGISTLQGAIRSCLAYSAGWRPELPDTWPVELGDCETPGCLKFYGPYLSYKDEYLFPAPLTFLTKEKKKEGQGNVENIFSFLKPGKEEICCDLGMNVRLPRPFPFFEGGALSEGLYLTSQGLSMVLMGESPGEKEVKRKEELWVEESRIGLERQDDTRTALESHLYRIRHIRPFQGVEINVFVSGFPEKWSKEVERIKVVPLGGEGRLATTKVTPVEMVDVTNIFPSVPEIIPGDDGVIRFTLTLVTSYKDPGEAVLNGPPGVPGRCVSACLGRMQLKGGWDIVNKEPRDLEPYLPPGSTWFYEAPWDALEEVLSLKGRCLGDKLAYGYGQVIIGKWEVQD